MVFIIVRRYEGINGFYSNWIFVVLNLMGEVMISVLW